MSGLERRTAQWEPISGLCYKTKKPLYALGNRESEMRKRIETAEKLIDLSFDESFSDVNLKKNICKKTSTRELFLKKVVGECCNIK